MLHQLWEQLTTQLANNELLAGGAILGGFHMLIGWIRPRVYEATTWLKARIVITLLISNDMDQYKWICRWVDQHKYMTKARRLSYEKVEGGYNHQADEYNPDMSVLGLAPGWHFLWNGWRPTIVERVRDKLEQINDSGDSVRNEMSLTVFGSRKYLNNFLREIEEDYKKWAQEAKGIRIYRSSDSYNNFTSLGKVPPRSLDSVLIPGKEKLVQDIIEFKAAKEWYQGLGVPWRRGYLLAGPPGCGKTSLVKAMASELNMDVYIINLAQIAGPQLLDVFNDAKGLVLIEDVDCAHKDRDDTDDEKKQTDLSYLLNAIDGVGSAEGRVLIMTTNYPERLDAALKRPGRVDLALVFGLPQAKELGQMFKRFFPESGDYEAWGERVEGFGVSMAMVQEYLVGYRHSPQEAFDNIHKLQEMEETRNAEIGTRRSIDSDPNDVGN
jgi:chaperone BCS1